MNPPGTPLALLLGCVCLASGWAAQRTAATQPSAVAFPSYDHAWVLGVVKNADHEVALTFDDCNDVGAWRSIVATLHRRSRHGVFFCFAQQVAAHPVLAKRLRSQGNPLCNHSWSHPDLTTLTAEEIQRQLRRVQTTLYAVTGSRCQYMRPPYGAYDRRVLRIAGRLGYRRAVLWTVDPRDWQQPGVGIIVSRVLGATHAGSVVLLHVLPQTASALPRILTGLHRRGLTVVSLPGLILDGDPSPGGWPAYRDLSGGADRGAGASLVQRQPDGRLCGPREFLAPPVRLLYACLSCYSMTRLCAARTSSTAEPWICPCESRSRVAGACSSGKISTSARTGTRAARSRNSMASLRVKFATERMTRSRQSKS